MKKMRIPLFIVLALAVVGVVLGSFFDLKTSQAIASRDNTFALVVSAFSPMIGLSVVPFAGGGFVALGLRKDAHVLWRIAFFVFAAGLILAPSIAGAAKEIFGVNGLYGVAPVWVGYLICILVHVLMGALGFWFYRKNENPNLWIVLLIFAIGTLLVSGVSVNVIKGIFHRPRYRMLVEDPTLSFHNWWQPFSGYKDYLASHASVTSEEFKSFPSGHAANFTIMLLGFTVLPLSDKRLEKFQLVGFFVSFALGLLVYFSRVLAAAHFLSDVSFGCLITVLVALIANEVAIRIKRLHPEDNNAENGAKTA